MLTCLCPSSAIGSVAEIEIYCRIPSASRRRASDVEEDHISFPYKLKFAHCDPWKSDEVSSVVALQTPSDSAPPWKKLNVSAETAEAPLKKRHTSLRRGREREEKEKSRQGVRGGGAWEGRSGVQQRERQTLLQQSPASRGTALLSAAGGCILLPPIAARMECACDVIRAIRCARMRG